MNKSEHRVHCNSLFEEPWWLEAVAPGRWGEVLIRHGGQVQARLPYTLEKRFGLTLVLPPPLTPCLGPWIRPLEGRYSQQLSTSQELVGELLAGLPRFDYYRQNCSPLLTDWLPYFWRGFDCNVLYTYRLEDVRDTARLWTELRENVRREIRKAGRRLEIRDDLGLEHFHQLWTSTFARQGKPAPCTLEFLRRLDQACESRQSRSMLFARDAGGRVHAAVYLVWDQHATYYLMGGGDPDLRSSGATSLLLWEAITRASGRTQAFDFEGSVIRPVERFFRAFNARQVPFFQLSSASSRMRCLLALRELGRAFYRLPASHLKSRS